MEFDTLVDPISNIAEQEIKRYNRLMLRLMAILFVVAILYYILNLVYSLNAPWFIFLGLTITTGTTYTLLKFSRNFSAAIFGILSFNFMIFLIASSETPFTNVNLYFASAGVAGLVLFGKSRWILASISVAISIGLYLLVRNTDISILPQRAFTDQQVEILSITNLLTFGAVTAYIIYLLLSSNYRKEKYLERQNFELVKINKELDRFIYSSSHDLRAPLTSLLGLIQLSELDKEEKLRTKYFGMMRKQISTMDGFINDLIDYSKNVRLDVSFTDFELGKLVKEVSEELRFSEGAKQLNIQCPDSTSLLRSDYKKLKVIFSNLISNAIKYRDKAKNENLLDITLNKTDYHHQILFDDNGIGIAPEHQDRIFDMFYRAHDSSIGSGLGLYIVAETVEKLGGSISVKSEQLIGTSFLIRLPIIAKNRE